MPQLRTLRTPADRVPLRLLWVEDVGDEIVSVVGRLDDLGHDVVHAVSRHAAQDHLTNDANFDGVVLDQNMPDTEVDASESGSTLMRQIRAGAWGDYFSEVPVVYATGFGRMVSENTQGMRLPPAGIVRKPLDREDHALAVVMFIRQNELRLDLGSDPRNRARALASVWIGPSVRSHFEDRDEWDLVMRASADHRPIDGATQQFNLRENPIPKMRFEVQAPSELLEVEVFWSGSRIGYLVAGRRGTEGRRADH